MAGKGYKELLLKDLCARLPYGIKCKVKYIINNETTFGEDIEKECTDIVKKINFDSYTIYTEWLGYESDIEDIKPYLRPLSSMTEEEKKELLQISDFDSDVDDICYDSICCIERTSIGIADIANFISWLNAHHFDYRGLIEKGLAIAVTKENNPYK